MGQSPLFLAATEHSCLLLHQATQKEQLRENLAMGAALFHRGWSLKNRIHMDLLSLYWEACTSASWAFRILWGTLVNKRANKLSAQLLWLYLHHCNRIQRFFFFKSRFKGLSSSIYFSVTKLPEICSVAVFIFWRRLQVGKRVLGRTYFFTFSWSQCVEIRLTAVLCTSVFSATSSPSINRFFFRQKKSARHNKILGWSSCFVQQQTQQEFKTIVMLHATIYSFNSLRWTALKTKDAPSPVSAREAFPGLSSLKRQSWHKIIGNANFTKCLTILNFK